MNKSSPSSPDKAIVSTVSSIIDSFVFGGLDNCTASWKNNLDAILKNVIHNSRKLSLPNVRFLGRCSPDATHQLVPPSSVLPHPQSNVQRIRGGRKCHQYVGTWIFISTNFNFKLRELGSRVAARRQMSAVSEHDDQLPEDFIQAALKQNKNYS